MDFLELINIAIFFILGCYIYILQTDCVEDLLQAFQLKKTSLLVLLV